jgi:hypothetical protein
LPETVLSPQGVLMEVSNDAFIDYEEWMVILYDDILMCANTINVAYEAYEKLKLVLQPIHSLSIALKILKA